MPQRDPPTAREVLYPLPTTATFERIAAGLGRAFSVEARGRGGTRTCLDTFDRRLLARREALVFGADADATALRWETVGGRLLRRLPSRTAPAFAADLPGGPFRDALARVIDVRRLDPIARARLEGEGLAVQDRHGKIVARARLERWHAPRGQARRGASARWLRVSPVRGYEKRLARVQAHLEETWGLVPATPTDDRGWLGIVAPWIETPAPDEPVPLEPDMRADAALKRVLGRQAEAMRRNEAGTRDALDPEYLHDFRVAIRRTRAALSCAKEILPAPRVGHFKGVFRWLGGVTSPRRDLDVHVLNYAAYEAELPARVRPHLALLGVHLRVRQEEVQRPLVRALGSARYRRLLDAWETFLAQPGAARTRLRLAARPALDVASRLTARQHRRVLERGLKIDAHSPAEALHRVRLDGKKLRYLLEFFRGLYDTRAIQAHVKAMKRLQDCLGDFNDYEVQQGALQQAAAEMVDRGQVPPETLVAIGQLVESLAGRQRRERDRFLEVFGTFASKKNRARARGLFGAAAEARA